MASFRIIRQRASSAVGYATYRHAGKTLFKGFYYNNRTRRWNVVRYNVNGAPALFSSSLEALEAAKTRYVEGD